MCPEYESTEPPVSMIHTCFNSTESIPFSDVQPRVMGLILSIASCIIISLNLPVAAALLKLLLNKGSQSWCFVLNLALADTLVGVAITGLAIEDFNSSDQSNNITLNQYWYSSADPLANITQPAQGKTRCLMRMASVMSPCTASILSIFLISLDRYAAIKMPLRYSQLSGKLSVVGSLLVLWISSFTLGFMPVMVQQLQKDSFDGFCAFFSVIHPGNAIVLMTVIFFPVVSAFVYIYLDILKIACSHHRQIHQVRKAGSRTANHRVHQQQEHHHHHHHLQRRYWSHFKGLKTVGVLVGCFIVLWCPFFSVCIAHLLLKSWKLKIILENYLWLLGLCNSIINPLVYAFWQREVRQQLTAMFCCCTGGLLAAGRRRATKRGELPNVLTQSGVPERP